MSPHGRVFKVRKDDAGRRLDRVLRILFPRLPLSAVYRAVRVGAVRVEGRRCRPERILAEGETILVTGDLASPGEAAEDPAGHPAIRPVHDGMRHLPSMDSMLVHRTPQFLALNKPRGIPTHGRGSIEEIVRRDLSASLPPSLSFTPGPLHRLDAGSTGLLLFSASLEGSHGVTAAFREKRVEKTYIAVLDGTLTTAASWKDVLSRDGKEAAMDLQPLACADGLTLALCRPVTGRYHQIRLQGTMHGHPLCGDRKHGGSGRLPWFLLHCASIRFTPPLFGVSTLSAPLPQDSSRIIGSLFGLPVLQRLFFL
jgi:23S rRNA pseudouridine955/2504/2580 synthase